MIESEPMLEDYSIDFFLFNSIVPVPLHFWFPRFRHVLVCVIRILNSLPKPQ